MGFASSRAAVAHWALPFVALALMGAVGTPAVAAAAELEPLEIVTRAGPVAFKVEIAATDEQRMRGLMYRTEVAPDYGMLFDFRVQQPIYMWMKNTYVPLDMIFIRNDGHIASIAANTTPLSTATITSGGPVRAVLEVAGGTAKARGIAVGDKVVYRLFPKD